MGSTQFKLLLYQQGESDLVCRRGEFYLEATCEVPADDPQPIDGFLGVDLGIVNIATDSTGQHYSGTHLNNVRHRHRRLREKLQKKQTNSARRKLKRLAGKEYRFAQNTNHTISKCLVEHAQRHSLGIALEELSGIRERVTVKRAQRTTLHSWSFAKLREYIVYKAQRKGIPVVLVDPRNTSRTCSQCGCLDKRSRRPQGLRRIKTG